MEKPLTLRWLAQEIGIESPQGETEIIHQLPFTAEAGGRVFMRHRSVVREFGIGDLIDFSAQDFAEICWTFFLVCNEINQAVEEFGREHGCVFPDNPAPGDGTT